MIRYFLILLCLLVVDKIHAQAPTADFNMPNIGCLQESLHITNLSTNSNAYNWDFCIGDFDVSPTISSQAMTNLGSGYGFDMVEDSGIWYAFVVDLANRSVFRLDYGDSPLREPVIQQLVLPDGLFAVRPEDISILKFNDQWHGVIAYGENGGSLIRLDFGADITNNSPTAINIGSFGNAGRIRNAELIEENGKLILVISVYGSNSLWRIDYRDSFDNIIDPVNDIYQTPSYSSLNLVTGFDIKTVNGDYIVHVISILGTNVLRLNFGTSLLHNPVEEGVYNLPGLNFSFNIKLAREGRNYYGFVTSERQSARLYNFGDLTSAQLPTEITYTQSLPSLLSVDMFKYQGRSLSYGTFRNSLVEIENFYECPASISFSEEEELTVSFFGPGTYEIDLVAFNTNGSVVKSDFVTKSLVINNSQAPDIDLTTQTICVQAPVEFRGINSSGTINSYFWDFGDTNTSTDSNPLHTYSAPGNYEVTLAVQSTNGCNNKTGKTIIIYDEPVPSFILPTGINCTNQPIFIENTTTGDFGGNETWQWQINGINVSLDRDFTGGFANSGLNEVKLIASIPGCSNELAQNINIQEGPIPSFTVDDACQGTLMNFSNGSSGDIISYMWDFDNGFTSNLENPSLEYSDAGSYNVSLTVENSLGCATTAASLVTVYSNPLVQFSNELSCSQDITQFNDLSTVDDANIVSWRWDFDDPGSGSNSSTDQNATHIFSGPGNFDVELVATSVFGCEDSLTQVIPVLPAPGADFTFDRACIGEPVNFQDTSIPVSGESITSWAWDIAGQFSAEQNPSSTFNVALDYNVTLFVTSENLCVGSTSRVVSIAEAAEVEFGTDFQCENQPVKFFDLTATNGDAVNSWSWDFEGRGQANDSTVFFDFGEVGQFVVDLDILTANGCSYSSQRAVVVNAAPTAAFTPSATFGAPPLEVQFTNESVDASTFLWTFEEGVTATTIDPSHIYNDLGEFETQLIATNDAQCRDTVSQQILVLLPDLEVELNGLFVVEDGQQSLVLSLTNNGTLRVEEMVARVDLGGNLVVTEIIDQRLDPQQTINYTLNLSITENQLSYICVEIIPAIEGLEDSNPANNSRCEDFSDDGLVVSHPYPNPVTGVIHMNVVTETGQPLTVRLINSTGGLAKSYDLLLRDGFNEISLNVDDLTQGIYFLQIPSLDRVDQVFISR